MPAPSTPPPSSTLDLKRARIFVVVLATVVLGLVAMGARDASFVAMGLTHVTGAPMMLYIHFVVEWLASPWFWGSLAIALLAEQLMPAVPPPVTQHSAYKYFYDLMWIPPKFVFFATLWPLYMGVIHWTVQKYLPGLVVQSADVVPWIVRMVGGLLLVDFLDWFTHVARHHVRVFWSFHSIHHSQTQLNFFTEYRSHMLDDILKWTIEAVPLILLQHTIVDVLTINRLRYWHTTIYHSNIRSNYGWLKYVLVTPQSHRIHHSLDPRHHDKNFGLTFSIWDHLFGTQHRNYDEYPATGIPHEDSPVEPGTPGRASVRSFVQQFFFPLLGQQTSPEASRATPDSTPSRPSTSAG